jgi:hypothetical protein
MEMIQPSLRDFGNSKLHPALKRRAIIGMSLWDKARETLRGMKPQAQVIVPEYKPAVEI